MGTETLERADVVTRIRRGCWRNVWSVECDMVFPNAGGHYVKRGEYVSERKWPSREIAEEKAREYIDRPLADVWRKHARYVEARFFPEAARD